MPTRVALAAALGALGCAAADPGLRRDLEGLRAEMRTIQRENAELARRVEALSVRLDAVAATRKAARPASAAPLVPPDLAVVKVEPPAPRPEPRRVRRPPPLPTAIPLGEPDPRALATLGGPRGDLAAEAQAALEGARRLDGLARARALEDFAARYPRHPAADNALTEAARFRDAAGDPETACALAARAAEEYPAGDALPEALLELGDCRLRKGDGPGARGLFQRIAKDFPETPAARRAQERLAVPNQAAASPAAPDR